ncbi:hypothetical protein BIV57_07370 [Mangrovactinospora gilvigrisea]|uniref:Sec-independent protein translocase protein TatA n=1 Tax=Mangrovactinospora gilvigrisea TaxID=1428644 RepID=A0A1J7CEL9_9ACTN|nr:Sec-independent protein translocase subunit TatA [Mangrovactinospora gilvigrisea]OIV38130.1 hypothetical protein BIV57_07370 [Mangrovactinospora gilvigrisea]
MLRNAFEPWHIILLVAVIALLFGSKRLPDVARGLGKSMRVLKAETKALKSDTTEGFKAGSAEGQAESAEARTAEKVTVTKTEAQPADKAAAQ